MRKAPEAVEGFCQARAALLRIGEKPTCHADVIVDERDKRGFGA
jgi:hypothetical protein